MYVTIIDERTNTKLGHAELPEAELRIGDNMVIEMWYPTSVGKDVRRGNYRIIKRVHRLVDKRLTTHDLNQICWGDFLIYVEEVGEPWKEPI